MKTLGYLCSEYPALSHTFVSREIDILQKEGFKIHAASINPVKNFEKMDAVDQARTESTYYVKLTPKPRMAALFLAYGLKLPRFVSALSYSLKLARKGGPRRLDKALGYFFQAILLHAWAREKGITHIHVHLANPAATVALIATRFGKLDFSLSVHGPDEFYNVEYNNLREKIEAAVFVRCISHYCRSQLMRLSSPDHWKKFHIVRCGVFPEEFPPRPPKSDPAKNILCIGRLCPSKGQALFVDVAKELRLKGLDFHILLIGGGEDLDTIRRLVQAEGLSDWITAAGPVERTRLMEELYRTDIFVLPSFAEGVPAVLMEAMAAGVPVVSTRIAGIPELIEHGEDGFLVSPSDVEGLSSLLESFLLGRVDTRMIAERAVAKVRSLYDVGKNAKALGAVFETLGDTP